MGIFGKKKEPAPAAVLPDRTLASGQMLNEQAGMPDHGVLFARQEAQEQERKVIDKNAISRATELLRKYKAGKARLERRVIENEQWWKLRHWDYVQEKGTTSLQTKSAWLVNVILSKHADAMDAMPEPNCLPRARDDEEEAKSLSAIVPVVLQRNGFDKVWRDNWWKKLKAGFAIYGVFWDPTKLNGLGDVAIRTVDPLNLFWEPGIRELQESQNIFHVELRDNEQLIAQYPQLNGKLTGQNIIVSKYLYDDNVDTSGKSPVVDWYYKKQQDGKTVLHYVKFVGETVLYATADDNEPLGNNPAIPEASESMATCGLYDHGLYPFFMDVLFPEEGTPAGFGYIDVCKDPQRQIDLMNTAIVANCVAAATPRWLKKGADGINEAEYADWSKPFVHVEGSLDETFLKQIVVQPLSGNYLNILVSKIDEMKETSGNRDVNNGGAPSGVTAASAIAAMQEQSGKLSRDQISTSYSCYSDVVYCVIELIRQFYDAPRSFRITGGSDNVDYVSYSNRGLKPVSQDLGIRRPIFDIEVTAQRQSSYSKLSNNEMSLQFFQLGFFNPQLSDQALAVIEMMDFKGKEALKDRIRQNGTMFDQIQQQQQMMMQMAATIDKLTGSNLFGQMQGTQPMSAPMPSGGEPVRLPDTTAGGNVQEKNRIVERAKAAANASTQPN